MDARCACRPDRMRVDDEGTQVGFSLTPCTGEEGVTGVTGAGPSVQGKGTEGG